MKKRNGNKGVNPEELRAYDLHTKSANFHTIGTHKRAHIDEAIAIMFLRKNKKVFPGIENAKIIFGFNDENKSAIEWAKEGVLLVGIGNDNPFNEHATKDRPEGYPNECAATLVAKYLGSHDKPESQQVMRYALFNDRNGDEGLEYNVKGDPLLCPNRFLPGSMLKTFYRVATDVSLEMLSMLFLNWVEMFYAIYLNDLYLFTKGKEEYQKSKIVGEATAKLSRRELERRRRKDPSAKDKDIFKIFFVRSESEFVLPYARLVDKNIGVFICRQKSGHFQIHTSNRYQLNLADVAKIVRRQHQEAKHHVVTDRFSELGQPGTVPGAEEIYYNKEMEGIYNGSVTHPDVLASPLSDEAISFAVRAGLGNWFYKDHTKLCETGICAHKQGKNCPLHRFGLARCFEVKKKMFAGNGKVAAKQVIAK